MNRCITVKVFESETHLCEKDVRSTRKERFCWSI